MINNLDNLALELANKALQTHFDSEAYIVKYIAEKKLHDEDLVPESQVDEFIKHLLNLFVTYSKNKNTENLMNLLMSLRQIISELYHTAGTKGEKDLIRQMIAGLKQVYS